jgi:hypothetical protein
MANSDAQVVEAIKTARDSVIAQIASGAILVEYEIRGRRVRNADPTESLTRLQGLLDIYERRATRGSSSPFKLASLQRPRGAS